MFHTCIQLILFCFFFLVDLQLLCSSSPSLLQSGLVISFLFVFFHWVSDWPISCQISTFHISCVAPSDRISSRSNAIIAAHNSQASFLTWSIVDDWLNVAKIKQNLTFLASTQLEHVPSKTFDLILELNFFRLFDRRMKSSHAMELNWNHFVVIVEKFVANSEDVCKHLETFFRLQLT